ncbi:hypothetical protein [Burkholderia ambifaria]|uniref:hypothetical protein n=1 Tax=Burkholderia ambifaria TaxID=152480 RepID=UPI00315CFCE6
MLRALHGTICGARPGDARRPTDVPRDTATRMRGTAAARCGAARQPPPRHPAPIVPAFIQHKLSE